AQYHLIALNLPAGVLRLGEHDGHRRLPLLRQGARRLSLGPSAARHAPIAASLRERRAYAHAGYPRRARLPRSGDAGVAVLQLAQGQRSRGATRLLSRRESLDPETAELTAVVCGILRVACAIHR